MIGKTNGKEGTVKEEHKNVQQKKPYAAPQVVTISLRPEEAVLGGCKSSGARGTSGTSCNGNLGLCHPAGS